MNVKFVDLTFSKRLRIVRRFIEHDGPVGLIRRRAEQLQVDVGLDVELVTDAFRSCENMNDVRGHFPVARLLSDQRANHRSLVHGVRAKPTIPALHALAAAGKIGGDQADHLAQLYRWLRRLEHVLQYRDDQQTQTLPRDAGEYALLAEVLGYADADALTLVLMQTRDEVAQFFDGTLTGTFGVSDATAAQISTHASASNTSASIPEATTLSRLGFTDAEATAAYLQSTMESARVRALPAVSGARMTQLVRAAISRAATTTTPDTAFKRTLDLLLAVASRSSYLALMIERPQVLDRVVDLAAASDWALRYVTKHPLLLDELMDGRTLSSPIDYGQWRSDLAARFAEAGDDAERAIDAIRHFQQGETFRLLLKDIAGLLPQETLSDHLSALADAVVEVTLAQLVKIGRAHV